MLVNLRREAPDTHVASSHFASSHFASSHFASNHKSALDHMSMNPLADPQYVVCGESPSNSLDDRLMNMERMLADIQSKICQTDATTCMPATPVAQPKSPRREVHTPAVSAAKRRRHRSNVVKKRLYREAHPDVHGSEAPAAKFFKCASSTLPVIFETSSEPVGTSSQSSIATTVIVSQDMTA